MRSKITLNHQKFQVFFLFSTLILHYSLPAKTAKRKNFVQHFQWSDLNFVKRFVFDNNLILLGYLEKNIQCFITYIILCI